MKKILVLGGTRFFGKKVVEILLQNGHEVTVATRGNTALPFKEKVTHIVLDVQDKNHKGWSEVINKKWDAVFDNVCYTKEDAEILIDKFEHVTEHLYFTSSMAVYSGLKDGYVETDFDPINYEINPSVPVTYGEGKRQAEQVLFNKAPFSVTAFRFPIVLDTDDYTKRLHFYVEKVLKGERIYFERPDVLVNYIKGSTAAASIVWAIENEKEGIYNVSSRDAVDIYTFVSWLEEELEQKIHVGYTGTKEANSPFSVSHNQYLNSQKIIEDGFIVSDLDEWLRPLIKQIGIEMEN